MAKYNQKFWKNEYSKKENIIKWFENYKTYCSANTSIDKLKNDFLNGELKEIKEIIEKEKEQKQIFEFVKNIISKEI